MPNRNPCALLALSAALAGASCALQAHDWPSPGSAPHGRQPAPTGWPGMLWAGPIGGAPAAPSARDCRRAPQPFELGAGGAWDPAQRHYHGGRTGERLSRLREDAAPREEAAKSADRSMADSLASSAAPPTAAAPQREQRHAPVQPPRPADEPVAAGVVDDNADFGAYLAYRERHAHLPVRARDVRERYGLVVHDARGRAVPGAEVTVYAAGGMLPLWARTDSGGRAWLHPQAAAPGWSPTVFEVQVHDARTGAGATALLQRGQKHQLQVTLSGGAWGWGAAPRPQLDVAFLVDATGSMADEIHKLKRSMRAMAEQIARLPSRPDLCFALVAYRDRGDAFFVRGADFTDDLGAFQQQLAQLQAGGGGDTPEALNEALHTAVHRLSWRGGPGSAAARMLILVADAPPHLDYDAPYYDDDAQAALAKGIKLFAVGASGLDAVGEYVFRQSAQYTGGRFVFLTYADPHHPSRGPGRETTHDVGNYSVENLDALIVRLVREEMAMWPK